MRTLFGQRGQPVGSTDGQALFDRNGEQIGFVFDDCIYGMVDGAFHGSFVNGVMYNDRGIPQAFEDGCADGVPIVSAAEPAMAPPGPRKVDFEVSDLPHKSLPDFFRARLYNETVSDGSHS